MVDVLEINVKYEYVIVSEGGKYPKDAVEIFEHISDFDTVYEMAEAAAELDFDYNNGSDDPWPKTFEIFKNGKSMGSIVVNLELVPIFRCKSKIIC